VWSQVTPPARYRRSYFVHDHKAQAEGRDIITELYFTNRAKYESWGFGDVHPAPRCRRRRSNLPPPHSNDVVHRRRVRHQLNTNARERITVMSMLSLPMVADILARVFAATVNPIPEKGVCFPEITCRTTNVLIETRSGDVPATVYHPPAAGDRPAAYVNVHGGGFVVGHPEQDDPWCRYLANRAGIVVINPDYVLAPQHRFPAAPQQIYDIVCWAADTDRDWDGSRLCVGGQSAGGNLSAAAARLALKHHTPHIALQVLHYAPLDLVTPTRDKPSTIGRRAVMKPWMGEVFDTAYIPDPTQRRDPLASPAWAAHKTDDLTGIAPAVVVTAEQDRLRNEARTYADMLESVGALREYLEVPDVDHGYNIMTDATSVTRETYDRIAKHVRCATPHDPQSI
jgi:acetyl esterase